MSKDSASPGIRLKDKFIELFGMDLRSLAALRVGTAVIVLIDLLSRAQDLVAHYTDLGIMPREAVLHNTNSSFISLHMTNGSPLFTEAMFCIAGFFALLLLIGYKTKFVSIVVFVLTLSLQNRNTWLSSGADDIVRLILFWGMFLPWGAKYSIDNLKYYGRQLPNHIVTAGTAAYLLQIVFIYFFTVQLKSTEQWQIEGTAVYYALSFWSFSTPFGQFLYQFPHVLKFLTYSTFWYEALGPILLFLPFYTKYIRTFAALLFMIMHFGFGFGLDLGIFSSIVIVAFFGFLPSFFWDKLYEIVALHRKKARPVNHPDEHSSVPSFSLSPIASFFCFFIIGVVFLWNAVQLPHFSYELPNELKQMGYALGIHQTWNLFALKRPIRENILFVAPGNLANGSVVDVIRNGRPVSFDAVELSHLPHKNHRWRKYYENILVSIQDDTEYYARYLCYDWNARHSDKYRLQSVEIYTLSQRIFLDYKAGQTNKKHILTHECEKQ